MKVQARCTEINEHPFQIYKNEENRCQTRNQWISKPNNKILMKTDTKSAEIHESGPQIVMNQLKDGPNLRKSKKNKENQWFLASFHAGSCSIQFWFRSDHARHRFCLVLVRFAAILRGPVEASASHGGAGAWQPSFARDPAILAAGATAKANPPSEKQRTSVKIHRKTWKF